MKRMAGKPAARRRQPRPAPGSPGRAAGEDRLRSSRELADARRQLERAGRELRSARELIRRQFDELRRRQDRLSESERHYRCLVEQSPIGIIVHSRGRVLYANPAASAMAGLGDARSMAGRTIAGLIHPGDRRRAADRMRKSLRDLVPAPSEGMRLLDRNGAVRHVEVVSFPLTFRGRPSVQTMISDLTGQRESEAELRQSEAKYRALAENSPDMIFTISRRGVVEYVNERGARSLGRPAAKIVGQKMAQLFPPEIARRQWASLRKVFAAGRPLYVENRTPFRGALRQLDTWLVPVRDGRGGVCQVTGISRDTTDRRTAEARLRESQALFQTLARISPVGIFRTDAAGSTTYVNPRWCQISGLAAERAVGSGWLAAVHPEDRTRVTDGWAAAVAADTSETVEYRFQRPDGSTAWVLGQAVPERDDRGEITGYVGTITDISAQKQTEARLRESELKHRTLLSGMNEALMQVDNRDIVQYVNHQFVCLLGYDQRDVLGKVGHRLLFPPEQQPLIRKKNRARLARVADSYQTVMRRKDGSDIRVQISGSPLIDANDQVVGSIGIITDISQQKRAEQELQESNLRHRLLAKIINSYAYSYRVQPDRTLELEWSMDSEPATGYTVAELKELGGLRQLIHHDDRDRHREDLSQVVAGHSVTTEFRIAAKHGGIVWLRSYNSPVWDGAGTCVVQIQGASQNITSEKRAEEALAASEENYRQVFEGVAEGIYRTSVDGRVLLANPALVRMLGYGSLEELAAIDLERDGYVEAESRRRFRQLLERDGEVAGYQSQWRRKDGTVITISESARVVKDADGSAKYFEGTVEDITEHVKADLALLDEKNKMSQLFEVSLSVARAGSIQEQLHLTMRGLDDLRLFRRMVLVIKDNDGRNASLAQVGMTEQEVEMIRNAPPSSERDRSAILKPQYRISNSYFIPHDDREVRRHFPLQIAVRDHVPGEWDANDNLIVPMAVKGRMIGYLSAGISVENMRLYQDLERSYYDTLKAFVAAMEAKDPYTKGHSENVRRYALKLARHLNLPDDRIRLIDFSSLLHDIGKMGIKEDILSKPTALSDREYEEVKQHPLIGSLMVSAIENLSLTGPIIKAHHEYYDGSGYPVGIRGEQIPIESRIISVADAFEAMTSDRPYRRAFGHREALQRLELASGTQFDREVVSAFIELALREEGGDGSE